MCYGVFFIMWLCSFYSYAFILMEEFSGERLNQEVHQSSHEGGFSRNLSRLCP